MKSYYARRSSGNKGGRILAVIMILFLGAAFYTMIRNKLPKDDPGYDFSLCYFYDQLDDADKEVYEIFYDMVMHKDDPAYSRSLSMEYGEYFTREANLYCIYYAMLKDHPEFFFLELGDGNRIQASVYTIEYSARVTFTMVPGTEEENEQIRRFEEAADEFMEDIDLNASDAEIELQIHDKLLDLVSYDYDVYEMDLDELTLAHTAYGALVGDGYGNDNCAVCSGYSEAFQYLLKKAGIMSVQIAGTGKYDISGIPASGDHAWNAVLLDGEWYEVDCTWDDADPNAPHRWYNLTTEEMSDHIRKIKLTVTNRYVFDYINEMLPVAEGTKY